MAVRDRQVIVERRHAGGVRGITGAIVLIGLGVAFLLQNLGIVTLDWWSLLRFWPVLLVLFGLDLLLGRTLVGTLISAILGLIIIGVVLSLAMGLFGAGGFMLGETVTRDIGTYELSPEVEALNVNIDIGAASVRVDGGAMAGMVVDGDYRTRERYELETQYEVSGGEAELTLTQRGDDGNIVFQPGSGAGQINLHLTEEILVHLNVNSGASELVLDLSDVQLASLNINGGVGTVRAILPGAGDYEVLVNGGIGTVDLTVPDSLSAELAVDGLTTTNVPARFDKVSDGHWAAGDYDDAEDRVSISVSSGIGTVNIR